MRALALLSVFLLMLLSACDSVPSAVDSPSTDPSGDTSPDGGAAKAAHRLSPNLGNNGCGITNLNRFLRDPSTELQYDENEYTLYDLRDGIPEDWTTETNGGITFNVAPNVGNKIIIGTEGPDVIRTKNRAYEKVADCIFGLGGDDRLRADGGEDYIRGGDGDDLLDVTGMGNRYGRLFGDAGNDVLKAYQRGILEMHGGEGNDELNAHALKDYLYGGPGDDVLRSDGKNMTSAYPAGSDVLYGGEGNDILIGGSDLNDLGGGEDDDYLDGGSGDDKLYGGLGRDKLKGGEGDDESYGGPGADTYSGFNVGDVIKDEGTYDQGRDALITARKRVDDRVTGPEGAPFNAYAAGIENFWLGDNGGNIDAAGFDSLSADQAETLANDDIGLWRNRRGMLIRLYSSPKDGKGSVKFVGSPYDDLVNLRGSNADNTVSGGAGNDRIRGGSGHDKLYGGPGADTYSGFNVGDVIKDEGTYDQGRDALITARKRVDDRVTGPKGGLFDAYAAGIENFWLGANGGDITAAGFDSLKANQAKTLANDNSGLWRNRRGMLIRLYSSPKGENNVEFVGSSYDDLVNLRRSDAANTVSGRAGNDRIRGGEGNDTLKGGEGNDRIRGGEGKDMCTDPQNGTFESCENVGTGSGSV